ncbi:Na+/H+ antiporter subunit E [Breoghania sp.]|uniref:Na+/H+ antiporter subunit E n=1 Tax=Breoghania sp. TaxID=2065378 RepID=UPI00261ABF77|nr:Na+/H+ antiporter subunit E [Breoghania sp.]MDJ0931791.1 Na+/H+ antiporter subunit E [Breoghania sp.]
MIAIFLINILMALAWGVMTGSFAFVNLAFGFILSSAVLYTIREQIGTGGYFRRVGRVASLAGLFFYELVLSACRVAKIVLTPDISYLRPSILAYPLTVDRDFEITLLANLITLTPGTLSVDVSQDRKVLYVHALNAPDPQSVIDEIHEGFERKILEAFR